MNSLATISCLIVHPVHELPSNIIMFYCTPCTELPRNIIMFNCTPCTELPILLNETDLTVLEYNLVRESSFTFRIQNTELRRGDT